MLALELGVQHGRAPRALGGRPDARIASSSRTIGTPKTAITASPMNFSTVPPWRSSDLAHAEVARHHLAQRLRIEALAERGRPARSLKSTVTVFRMAVGVGGTRRRRTRRRSAPRRRCRARRSYRASGERTARVAEIPPRTRVRAPDRSAGARVRARVCVRAGCSPSAAPSPPDAPRPARTVPRTSRVARTARASGCRKAEPALAGRLELEKLAHRSVVGAHDRREGAALPLAVPPLARRRAAHADAVSALDVERPPVVEGDALVDQHRLAVPGAPVPGCVVTRRRARGERGAARAATATTAAPRIFTVLFEQFLSCGADAQRGWSSVVSCTGGSSVRREDDRELRPSVDRGRGGRRGGGSTLREDEIEAGAGVFVVVQEIAAVGVRIGAGDRQAETAPAARVAAREPVEESRAELFGDTGPASTTDTHRCRSRCSAVIVTGGSPWRIAFSSRFETTLSRTSGSTTAAMSGDTSRCSGTPSVGAAAAISPRTLRSTTGRGATVIASPSSRDRSSSCSRSPEAGRPARRPCGAVVARLSGRSRPRIVASAP